MSRMPKMNLWIDAFNSDTSFLTNEELGIYFRLIFFAWSRGGWLCDDLDFIYTLTSNADEKKVDKILKLYWTKDGSCYEKGWYQKRLKEEYERAVAITEKNRENANSRYANALPPHNERIASISKSTSTSISKKSINTYFQIFWDMICYKISKGQARRNFEKLSKEWQEKADELARMYNKYYFNLGDKKFAKHPSTWLSSEGWEDEIPKESGFDKEEHEKYRFKQNCEMYKKGIRLQTWSRQDMEKFEQELANESN